MSTHTPERRSLSRRSRDRYDHTNHFRRMAAYVLLAVTGAFGLWQVGQAADAAQQAANDAQQAADAAIEAANKVEQASTNQTFELCQNSNEGRRVILDLIESQQTQGTDYSQIPGYENLDPEVKTFLKNLNIQQQDDIPSDFQVLAREKLAQQDCEAIVEGTTG